MSEIRREGARLSVLTLVLVLGSPAVAACSAPDFLTCESPRAVSGPYRGNPDANPNDTSTWTTGVAIQTEIPEGVKGLVVGFRAPNADWAPARDSIPVSPDRAAKAAVFIGNGDVVYSTYVKAWIGSSLCDRAPNSTFSMELPKEEVLQGDAVLPNWNK